MDPLLTANHSFMALFTINKLRPRVVEHSLQCVSISPVESAHFAYVEVQGPCAPLV